MPGKNSFGLLLLVVFFTVAAPVSSFALVLPPPDGTFDGLPVAVSYNDFFSYASQLLQSFYKTGPAGVVTSPVDLDLSGFEHGITAGTGTLDIVLLTSSPGTQNSSIDGIDPNTGLPFVFEAPASSDPTPPNTSTTNEATWGSGGGATLPTTVDDADGPVSVGHLLDYLHVNFSPDNNIPVFTFDLLEPGNAATENLEMKAEFYIWDPVTQTKVKSWWLNDTSRPDDYIDVRGTLSFTGASGTTYGATMTGSGKADYIVYAPTMNLALENPNHWFVIDGYFKAQDSKKQEAFISGSLLVPGSVVPQVVPEPSTLLLLGSGLLGMAFRRKK